MRIQPHHNWLVRFLVRALFPRECAAYPLKR